MSDDKWSYFLLRRKAGPNHPPKIVYARAWYYEIQEAYPDYELVRIFDTLPKAISGTIEDLMYRTWDKNGGGLT